jgi:hypothetical protein
MRLIVLLLATLVASAATADGIVLGKRVNANAPLCVTQAAAEQVAKIDAASGPEAGYAALMAREDCAMIAAVLKPVRVVGRYTRPDGKILRVIECIVYVDDIEIKAFAIADLPVENEYDT